MADQKHLSAHPHRDPDFPGIIFLTLRIRSALDIQFRTRKLPDNLTPQQWQREAERYAIEHWDGLIMMQIALPIGDFGRVHG